ncbi:hypothetical protein HUU53_04035 [Candidatus Micrarchaeota archaeon]|nr:hypothetical protein [Candidatus Micrarchaeota archaeon]
MDLIQVSFYVFSAIVISLSGYYAFSKKEKLDHMCCMMVGMIYSTLAGFAFGTLYAFFTGEYLMANIIGVIAGLIAAVLLNILAGVGDEFARMEGVMGAAMGGLMGAMLGFMIRFEDTSLFLAFYVVLLVLLAGEGAWFIYKHSKKKDAVCC